MDSIASCYVNTTHPDFIGGHKASSPLPMSILRPFSKLLNNFRLLLLSLNVWLASRSLGTVEGERLCCQPAEGGVEHGPSIEQGWRVSLIHPPVFIARGWHVFSNPGSSLAFKFVSGVYPLIFVSYLNAISCFHNPVSHMRSLPFFLFSTPMFPFIRAIRVL